MKPRSHSVTTGNNRGFTLVEVMVAMVIGMLGIIIMMQVFSAAEGQKRSTTGTGDAQSNGAMALYSLQRDIRQAGYGFNALNVLGCPLTLPATASPLTQLAPVVINPTDFPAGDTDTDTLLIIYGSSEGSPEGDAITLVAGSQLGVLTPTNFHVNTLHPELSDHVIAAPSAATNGCDLSLVTITAVSPPNVTAASSGGVDGGYLFNLGATPRILAYAVRAGNLTVCDYIAADCGAACTAADGTCSANWVPIANNIVSLRAQYGRDTSTPMDGIDTWDQTTPVQPSPANQEVFACLWARASALRIALVARNSQVDKDTLTVQAPDWEGSAGNPIDLSATSAGDWGKYRYKVFETVIPLRNLPWMALCT